jgi:hypothetical protein
MGAKNEKSRESALRFPGIEKAPNNQFNHFGKENQSDGDKNNGYVEHPVWHDVFLFRQVFSKPGVYRSACLVYVAFLTRFCVCV